MDCGILSGGCGPGELANAVIRREPSMVGALERGWREVDRSELCFAAESLPLVLEKMWKIREREEAGLAPVLTLGEVCRVGEEASEQSQGGDRKELGAL